MGSVTSLEDRRRTRASSPAAHAGAASRGARVTFFFDLGSPFTYLAAERVDRLFGSVTWKPVLGDVLDLPLAPRALAEARAQALGLPLVWPDLAPATARPAMRVASLAAERGRAAPFVLAASRLAFCGGFELDHPETLTEAAVVAGLGLDESLEAARDPSRDGPMEQAGLRLAAQGADRLPVLKVGRTLFAGEDRIAQAAAASRGRPARAG